MPIVCVRRWGLPFKGLEKTSTLPALLVVFACTCPTEPTEPGPSVALLVTNETCGSEQCSSFQVRGFWTHQPVYTPGGRWSMDLGTVSTGSACLILPGADTFRVNETAYVWTSRDSLSLGIMPPGTWQAHGSPSTSAFVPANSSGWSVTLPGGTVVTPAHACG